MKYTFLSNFIFKNLNTKKNYILWNNVSVTLSVRIGVFGKDRGFHPASAESSANFKVCLMYSQIRNDVTLLNNFQNRMQTASSS